MEPKNDKNRRRKSLPKFSKKKLDKFLAAICEAGGMGKEARSKNGGKHSRNRVLCQSSCEKAQWRAHLDIPSGVLCVSAAWSTNKSAEKHRDVAVAITYVDDRGKTNYTDMVFCDSEIRWVMETLWHAPIWE